MRSKVPLVTPEDFVYIPETGTYVTMLGLSDWKTDPRTGERELISYLTGYEICLLARQLGCHVASSEEWGKSWRYFHEHPHDAFNGSTGGEIADTYMRRNRYQQTGSILAFSSTGNWSRDVSDLLQEVGFDGGVALIDFPDLVEEDRRADRKHRVFKCVIGERTTVRDVTEIGGTPLIGDGPARYDEDTGLVVPLQFQSQPHGTRTVVRGAVGSYPRELSVHSIMVRRSPTDIQETNLVRVSSEEKIEEVLVDREALHEDMRRVEERTENLQREVERNRDDFARLSELSERYGMKLGIKKTLTES